MSRERRPIGGETRACTGGRRVGGGATTGYSICRGDGMSISWLTFASGRVPYIALGEYVGRDTCCVGLPTAGG